MPSSTWFVSTFLSHSLDVVFVFYIYIAMVVDNVKFEAIVFTNDVFNIVIVEVAIDSNLFCFVTSFLFSGYSVIVCYFVYVKAKAIMCIKDVFNIVIVDVAIDSDLYCFVTSFSFSGYSVIPATLCT